MHGTPNRPVHLLKKSLTIMAQNEDAHDILFQLPSDIRESIFSLLSLKEAAATSIICHRWHHMWQSSTRTLDFVDETLCSFGFSRLNQESRERKRRNYVEWVDKVVEQHTGPTIEQFKARFSLDHRFTSSIDDWIIFALKKRVQVLVLDFIVIKVPPYTFYTFPCKLLGLQKGSPAGSAAGFESLKALHLSRVSLTGEVLECLLSNCQVLERLTLTAIENLVDIRVVGPLSPLKYLVVGNGYDHKRIEIRDANLVSFYYSGIRDGVVFAFSNVPLLVEVSLLRDDFVRVALSQLSCCLPQLETLRLDSPFGGLGFLKKIPSLPALTSLKHFELAVNGDSAYYEDFGSYTRLSQVVTLIKASPYLQSSVLELDFTRYDDAEADYIDFLHPMKLQKSSKWRHHCLKVMEIKGYRGRPHIVEYVMDLIESAVALEKIVIDPTQHERWSFYPVDPDTRAKKSKKPRDHAMHQLKRMVPSTIEFVCL